MVYIKIDWKELDVTHDLTKRERRISVLQNSIDEHIKRDPWYKIEQALLDKLTQTKERVEQTIKSASWASKYDIQVMYYGSTVNGLLSNGASDVDLVVLLLDKVTGQLIDQSHKKLLELIMKQV